MSSRSVKAWEIAAEALGLEYAPRRRPNPAQWLWYAYWGPLPPQHAIWVLYDATCSTWVARYLARLLAAATLPVTLIAVFLPASAQVRGLTAAVTGAYAVLFAAVWINESTEHRIVRAGYDWGVAPELRAKRSEIAQLLRHW